MDKLKGIIETLKKNPLYYFSRASTELFHSNFWYWLSTIDENETIKLFDPSYKEYLKENEKPKFDREKKHIDLTIETDNKIIIIENKIKSVAENKQLNSYYETFTANNCKNKQLNNLKFILLSPQDNDFLYQDKWEYLSYQTLSSRLRDFKINNSYSEHTSTFYYELINYYSDLLNAITDVIKYFNEYNLNNKYFFTSIPSELKNEIERIKMYDIIMKIGAAKFAYKIYQSIISDSRFRNYIKEDFNSNMDFNNSNYDGNNIFVKYGYSTNKGPIIDIFFPFKFYILKIQIEGDTYKYVFEHFNKKVYNNFKKISDYLLKERVWFSEDLKGKGRDKLGVNKYKSKNYEENFHYKWKEINNDLSDNLTDIILNDIYYASKKIMPRILSNI